MVSVLRLSIPLRFSVLGTISVAVHWNFSYFLSENTSRTPCSASYSGLICRIQAIASVQSGFYVLDTNTHATYYPTNPWSGATHSSLFSKQCGATCQTAKSGGNFWGYGSSVVTRSVTLTPGPQDRLVLKVWVIVAAISSVFIHVKNGATVFAQADADLGGLGMLRGGGHLNFIRIS